jgi:hypothetical protein
MKKGIGLIAVIAVIIVVAAFVVPRYVNSASTINPSGIATSGFIEATDVSIAAEVGGRIISIAAAEGDLVAKGILRYCGREMGKAAAQKGEKALEKTTGAGKDAVQGLKGLLGGKKTDPNK